MPSYVWLAREDYAKFVSVPTRYPESDEKDHTRAHFKAYDFAVGDSGRVLISDAVSVIKQGERSAEFVEFTENPLPDGAVEVGIDRFYPVSCRRDHAGLIHLVEIRIV